MKSFIVSLCLLLLMLTGIIFNAIYINKVTSNMDSMIAALPDVHDPNCASVAAEIRDYWERNLAYVGLSVPYCIVDRVSEQAATLCACAACEDVYGFRTALALLSDAVSDSRRLERIEIGNLL